MILCALEDARNAASQSCGRVFAPTVPTVWLRSGLVSVSLTGC